MVRRSLLLLVLLCPPLAVGCGESAPSTPDAGPLPVDQCLGASDLAIIEGIAALHDGGVPDGGVPDGGPYPETYADLLSQTIETCITGTCFLAVISETGFEECIVACVESTPAAGISLGCLECHAEVTRCATDNCLTLCLGDDRAACELCALEACRPRHQECIGLPVRDHL